MKNKKGITLIALIITILVMLILVGVVISMAIEEEGVIKQAGDADEKTSIAQIIEETKIQVLDKQISKEGKVYKEDLITVLESKGTLSDEDNILDKTLTTNDGNYEIAVREIYDGILYEKPAKPTIIFKIESVEYTAEEGMTWLEWVNSEYNVDDYYSTFNGYVLLTDRGYLRVGKEDGKYNSSDVKSEELIISGFQYYEVYYGAECVFPNSKILNSENGNYTLAKDIKENDKILYFDFEKNTIETGNVLKVYVHKDATNFVKYTFEDESYLEATDYHPIYTKDGWKSATGRNGYEKPKAGDEVKTAEGWKKISKIELWHGLEDCYDFEILSNNGIKINNYFANETLVQGSY